MANLIAFHQVQTDCESASVVDLATEDFERRSSNYWKLMQQLSEAQSLEDIDAVKCGMDEVILQHSSDKPAVISDDVRNENDLFNL